MKKILVVEDDRDLSELLRYNLERAHHCPICCFNAELAWRALQASPPPDLVVLDISLTRDSDGLDILQKLRDPRIHTAPYVPVIILSGQAEESSKLLAFETGADDYVTKPFYVSELMARIKIQIQRNSTAPPTSTLTTLTVRDICIDQQRRQVRIRGQEVVLSATEFKLLLYLACRLDRVCSQQNILDDVWEGREAGTDAVKTNICRLRHKLGDQSLITLVQGRGYMISSET